MLTHCLKLPSLPSPSQLCQSERTPVELQRISPSGSSHFCTIERQDSFDMGYEPVISCGRVGRVTVVRPQPRTQSLDLGSHARQTTPLSKEENPHFAHSTPSDLSWSSAKTNVDSTQALESTLGKEEDSSYSANLGSKDITTSVEHSSTVTDIASVVSKNSMVNVIKPKNAHTQVIKESEEHTVTATSPRSTELSDPLQQGVSSEQSEQGSTSSAAVSEGDSGIDPCAEGGEEDSGSGGAEGSAGGSLTNRNAPKAEGRDADSNWTAAEGSANSSEASSKVEQQDKRKGEGFVQFLCVLTF